MLSLLVEYPKLQLVLSALGTLVVFAQVIVVITPSKKDDEKLEELMGNSMFKKAIDWLKSMALIQKK